MQITRCRHIKVNGTQCGSPALRCSPYCYFHNRWRTLGTYGRAQKSLESAVLGAFPVLEDANSIQAALMQVIRLMLSKQIAPKEAGLLLYALQIASSNLKRVSLEPWHQQVVVDPLLMMYSPVNGYPKRQEERKKEIQQSAAFSQNPEGQALMEECEQLQRRRCAVADARWLEETGEEFDEITAAPTIPQQDPAGSQESVDGSQPTKNVAASDTLPVCEKPEETAPAPSDFRSEFDRSSDDEEVSPEVRSQADDLFRRFFGDSTG